MLRNYMKRFFPGINFCFSREAVDFPTRINILPPLSHSLFLLHTEQAGEIASRVRPQWARIFE